jgi:hypothetical protein
MARKFCPSCNKLNAGSATRCRCGYAFAASTIRQARRTTKRCPACQQEQPRLLQVCGCGHEFGDIHEVREQLEERVRIGWSYIALGTTALLVCTGITIATSGIWIIGAFCGVTLIARGFATRADARWQLRDIQAAARALPSAKVVRTPQGQPAAQAGPDGR